MASRKEQKERAREARLAAEREAAKASSRNRRLQYALGAVIAIGIVAAVVAAVVGGGGGDKGEAGTGSPSVAASNTAKIPGVRETDLAKAAAAAGCVLKSPAIQGFSHVTTSVKYATNPPTSGDHNPDPALDGVYPAGNEPTPEHYVHTLEHGRVEIQYRKGSSARLVSQLTTLYNEPVNGLSGYKTLLFENNTRMPYAVAATSWGQMLSCPRMNPRVFDALRAFRVKYVDHGREIFPPNNQ
jgi:hypothetical protein